MWSVLRAVLCFALTFAAVGARADEVVTRLPTEDRVVALTFDACEAYEKVAFDRSLLEFLLSREIPFTVFASGRFVENNADDIRMLAALPYVEIENHSFDHPNTMNRFSAAATERQVLRADEIIAAATGRKPQFFRFPAGKYNKHALDAVRRLGYTAVHWRWASGDPDRSQTADRLVSRVTSKVQPGDVLIFHINGRGWHSAEAMPRIVDALQADGYRFALLSDYMGLPRREPSAAQQVQTKTAEVVSKVSLLPVARSLFGIVN